MCLKHRFGFLEVYMTMASTKKVAAQFLLISKRQRGRPAEYHDGNLEQLIYSCWLQRERMCAKRLVFQLESWLQEYEAAQGPVSAELRSRFLSISAATIDRVLKPLRDACYGQTI